MAGKSKKSVKSSAPVPVVESLSAPSSPPKESAECKDSPLYQPIRHHNPVPYILHGTQLSGAGVHCKLDAPPPQPKKSKKK